jgi:hypothetical protein
VTTLQVSMYLIALSLMTFIFVERLRRSEFGILVVLADVAFLCGGMIYPVLLSLGAISPGIEGEAFITRNGLPDLLTAAHVLLYASGCAIGVYASRWFNPSHHGVVEFSRLVAPDYRSWTNLLLVGLIAWGLYFWLVGPADAIGNAVLTRSGDFEGLGDSQQFLFLKTLASLSLYAVCAVPIALQREGTKKFILLFFALVVIWFINSVSRNAILFYVITPLLIFAYCIARQSPVRSAVVMGTVVALGIVTLLFGTSIGWVIAGYLGYSDTLDISSAQYAGNLAESYLRNVEYYWFSVAAGIQHFMSGGPHFPVDVFAAAVGFFPTSMFSAVNLQNLDYRQFPVTLTCVNTDFFFSASACTIPPFWFGYSAYLLPLAGGLLFGILRYFLFGVLESLWVRVRSVDPYHSWVLYFIALTAISFMSLIPTVVAQATIALIALLAVYHFKQYRRTRVLTH